MKLTDIINGIKNIKPSKKIIYHTKKEKEDSIKEFNKYLKSDKNKKYVVFSMS